jgi:hypothetical protein
VPGWTAANKECELMQAGPNGFIEHLQNFDPITLNDDGNVVYGLNAELRLAYFNPAWHRFARENGGEALVEERYQPGTPVLDAIAGPLRDFYAEAYTRVLETGEVWQHDYECSSPEVYRVFHQTVYPLRHRQGLVVVNSLAVSSPMALERRTATDPGQYSYHDARGLITQCSHCRRVQRADGVPHWDWVPTWVSDMPRETSHGLCPLCYDFYYRYRRR